MILGFAEPVRRNLPLHKTWDSQIGLLRDELRLREAMSSIAWFGWRKFLVAVTPASARLGQKHLTRRSVAGLRTGIKHLVERAARRAQLQENGVHRLRHTFCSHLARRGAPARAIQELAGHQDLSTTQHYMHLSPAAIEGAIRLLDLAGSVVVGGDRGESGSTEIAKFSR